MYKALESKTISAMKVSALWSNFLGIFVHDHETGLYHFGTEPLQNHSPGLHEVLMHFHKEPLLVFIN